MNNVNEVDIDFICNYIHWASCRSLYFFLALWLQVARKRSGSFEKEVRRWKMKGRKWLFKMWFNFYLLWNYFIFWKIVYLNDFGRIIIVHIGNLFNLWYWFWIFVCKAYYGSILEKFSKNTVDLTYENRDLLSG